MYRTDSPNQIRPLRGSIPAVCPERLDRSCCCWYSAHICLASAEFAFTHISGVSFMAHSLYRSAVQDILDSSSYPNTTVRSQRPTLHNSLQSARRAPFGTACGAVPHPQAVGAGLKPAPTRPPRLSHKSPCAGAPFDGASFAFALLRSGQASPFGKGGLRGIFPARVPHSERVTHLQPETSPMLPIPGRVWYRSQVGREHDRSQRDGPRHPDSQ